MQFRARLLKITLILLTCVLIHSTWACAAEFSADVTITDKKSTVAGKIFVAPDKLRQELESGDGPNITIIRFDTKVMWTLLPDNVYMEISGDKVLDPNAPVSFEYEINNLGSEVVNGYTCDKLQYVYEDKKLGSLIQWVAQDLQYAVRTESFDRKGKTTSVTEFTNIKLGPQPDSLFELPPGYSKFELPIKLPFDLFGN